MPEIFICTRSTYIICIIINISVITYYINIYQYVNCVTVTLCKDPYPRFNLARSIVGIWICGGNRTNHKL